MSMKIAGVAYTLVVIHPDELDYAEEIDVEVDRSISPYLRDATAWKQAIEEAQSMYDGYMRVRGMSGLYGETIVDLGTRGRALRKLTGESLGR